MTPGYSPLESDIDAAAHEWGANCGPAALAFAIQVPISLVRSLLPEFGLRRYTNVSMMASALRMARRPFETTAPTVSAMFSSTEISLVRVQWSGPWTATKPYPIWSYSHTHWIAAWQDGDSRSKTRPMVYDVNCGICPFADWKSDLVPKFLARAKGRDGWFPTHVWRVRAI